MNHIIPITTCVKFVSVHGIITYTLTLILTSMNPYVEFFYIYFKADRCFKDIENMSFFLIVEENINIEKPLLFLDLILQFIPLYNNNGWQLRYIS